MNAGPITSSAAADEPELLRRYHVEGDFRARAALAERLMPLVRHIAHRYTGRGEPLDDLIQVGCVGLLKAIDRFDIDRGLKLSTFAAPNIAGEIKRHFRDRGWMIRVPRDLQELRASMIRCTDELTTQLGRSPTVDELAETMETTVERVLETMVGARHYGTESLDEPMADGRDPAELIGDDDAGYDRAEDRVVLRDGFDVLDDRDREILRLRFVEGLTQREIAESVGLSQMHISRLIRRALERMRVAIAHEAAA